MAMDRREAVRFGRALPLAALALWLSACSAGSPVSTPLAAGASSASGSASDARSVRSGRLPAGVKGLTVLYAFRGDPDGYYPYGGIVLDSTGKVFGTTAYGGASGYGTVFELAATDKVYAESVLHDFTKADGAVPLGIQIVDADRMLIATAEVGGSYGEGTAVELTRTGKVASIRAFNGANGGSYPESAGLFASGRTIYTTTYAGGKYGAGAIVALAGSGTTPQDVYDFTGGSGGEQPQGVLAADSSGALYGTTSAGGAAGLGTVYKFVAAPGGGTQTVLWSFQGGSDGANPSAGVILDAGGNLYGTTLAGGAAGDGVVFKIASGSGTESILHAFSGAPDGAQPYAGLATDGSVLYGTTFAGGGGGLCQAGCGTIFVISPSGAGYALLHNFASSDGSNPAFGSLVIKGKTLYGETVSGGANGYGEVYSFIL